MKQRCIAFKTEVIYMQCTIVHSRKNLLIHWGKAMSRGDHILRAKNDRYFNFLAFFTVFLNLFVLLV
jgi:hypothetical protein